MHADRQKGWFWIERVTPLRRLLIHALGPANRATFLFHGVKSTGRDEPKTRVARARVSRARPLLSGKTILYRFARIYYYTRLVRRLIIALSESLLRDLWCFLNAISVCPGFLKSCVVIGHTTRESALTGWPTPLVLQKNKKNYWPLLCTLLKLLPAERSADKS